MSENESLAQALARVSREIDTANSVQTTLESIMDAARASIDGIDHVGISLSRRDGSFVETMATTDDMARRLDALQYGMGEGPCLSAIDEERMVLVEHARHEQRWPRYIPAAVEMGLEAQLGVQLYLAEDTLGVLNMYSTSTETLEADAVHMAELFAAHAAIALGRSQSVGHLNAAVASRQVIGQAVGIMMERFAVDGDTAFRYLTRLSSHRQVKLRLIAQQVVDDTSRRVTTR